MKYVIGTWLAEVLTSAWIMKSNVSTAPILDHEHHWIAPLNVWAEHY
jgi:hypothetical protein